MVDPAHAVPLRVIEPESLDELAAAAAGAKGAVVCNWAAEGHPFGLPTPFRALDSLPGAGRVPDVTSISLKRYCGIVEHDVDDQVVVVRAGTTVGALQSGLGKVAQCLPMPQDSHAVATMGTGRLALIDEICFNLPHALAAQCGSWRDWVLGMKLVLADGSVVKCGSKAVKNVAGYDVQKLMIGARGTLGLIAEVTLRTFPLKALPTPVTAYPSGMGGRAANWVQRVLPTDFDVAVASAAGRLAAFDPLSSTLWGIVPPEQSLKRFEGDWVLRSECGARNLELSDPTVLRLMKRAKDLFDPQHKLNPGEMGIL